jgi:thiamine-phosphate pyrophosphorylase
VCDPVGLDYLSYVVKNLNIPFVAIGGIKEDNLAEVVKAKARTIAFVTEIVSNPDISGKIKSLRRIMGA